MSGIRGIGDAYAFQRLLWLLVGTVIVPTVLLSLFGVAAIRNQGAAVLHELDRQRAERLEQAARAVVAEVQALEDALVREAAACASSLGPCARAPGTSEPWSWRVGEPVPAALDALGIPSEVPEGRVVWLTPADGTAPIALLANGGLRAAWRLDPSPLRARLDALAADRWSSHVRLDLTGPAPLDEWDPRTDVPAFDLPRPLAGWRVLLDDAAEPTRAALTRNSWLYPASLVLLVGLVLVGTVITLGSAAREFRLSRLQTDFVSNVSHELRTPLTSIGLFVEMLQSGRLRDPEKVAECLDLLGQETDRLSRRIERVLDWAKMEAGRRSYDFGLAAPVDLADEALRALRSQRLLAEEPDRIELDVPPDLPELRVDRDAIVEALLNLLQNAVKYTGPPRRISLRAARRGRWVAMTVEDNGPGIPKQSRKRVFEKFYQVDQRLSAPNQGQVDRGSGLGLAIVRAVVRAHGGHIVLDTELGRGSRFSVWLPVAGAR